MAGEVPPTLEESTAALHGDFAQLLAWADPGGGIGMAVYPQGVADALSDAALVISQGLDGLAGVMDLQSITMTGAAGSLSLIAKSLNTMAAGDGQGGLDGIRDVLTQLGEDVGQALGDFGTQLTTTGNEIHWDLQNIDWTLSDGLNCICYAIHQLTGQLGDGGPGPGATFDPKWTEFLELLADPLEKLGPRLLGEEPVAHSWVPSWLGSALADGPIAALRKTFNLSPGGGFGPSELFDASVGLLTTIPQKLWDAMGGEMTGLYTGNKGPVAQALSGAMAGVSHNVVDWYLKMMQAGPCKPDQAQDRLAGCLGFASVAGLTSHVVSAILSMDILACLDINATGLAAMITDLAGFGPILGAFQGPFFDAYLKKPWTANLNRKMRPARPDPATLMRLRYKSRASGAMGMVESLAGFREQMSYHGFSDEWIAALEDDLYTEPRRMDIMLMAESDAAAEDPTWWREKMSRLGYTDVDAEYLIDGVKRRMARAYRDGYIHQLISQVRNGRMAGDDLDSQLADFGVPGLTREAAVALAGAQAADQTVTDGMALLKSQYDRDQINDRELRDGLDALGLVPEKVDYLCAYWRLGRYHKVYLSTPTEEARKVISLYRQAYRAGIIPRGRYSTMLSQAGLSDDTITVQLALDDQARDQAIVTSLRQYALPLGRDAVASGRLAIGQYRQQLAAQKLPGNLLDAEVAYATMLREREQTARLERRQIAPAERAYVFGLVPSLALNLLYQQAGYSADEIAVKLLVLNELRRAHMAAQAKAAAAPARKAPAKTGGGKIEAGDAGAAAAAEPPAGPAAGMTPEQLLGNVTFSAAVIAYLTGQAGEADLTALWKEAGAQPAAISLALQQIHLWM